MPLYYQNEKLFSEIYLEEITAQPEREEVLASLRVLREYRDYAEIDNLNTWVTSYIHEVLAALGFNPVLKTDALTLLNPMGTLDDPVSLCYVTLPVEDLDNTTMGRNWAEKVIRSLREQEMQWGLLTNGKLWRIYHLDEPMPYETYFEIDLDTILTNQAQKAYQIFHKFMKAENFVVDEENQCQFDCFKKESKDKVDYIENELQNALKQQEEGGQGVLSDICMGYVEELRNAGDVNLDNEDMRQKIYHGAMLYMFRLLFLFYADARGLLSDDNHDLLQQAANKANSHHRGVETTLAPFSLWKLLEEIFVDIDQTYNGGLFSPQESEFTQFIEETRIKDQYLAPPFHNLTTYKERDGSEHLISYRDMGVRHLGTLYEGLLEHKLFIASEDTQVKVTKGKVSFIPVSKGGKLVVGQYLPAGSVYFAGDPSERKSTGSYYTPEYIVDYIVQDTVGKKISELKSGSEKKLKADLQAFVQAISIDERQAMAALLEEKLVKFVRDQVLQLSVLDPAMGSGHFLVNSTNLIANAITEYLNEFNVVGDSLTGTAYWRRWVVENCIYGVDINSLAVELAKLSLWILSMAKNQPLSFMNHHLKCGNSLIGAKLVDIGKFPNSRKIKDPTQLNLFDQDPDFKKVVEEVISKDQEIATRGSNSIVDVQEKNIKFDEIQSLLEMYKLVCDIHSESHFRDVISEDNYYDLVKNPSLAGKYSDLLRNSHFHWELEFPQIFFSKTGFDCIIGNPPYIVVSKNEVFPSIKNTKSTRNLFSYFIEVGTFLLSSEGFMSYIIPISGLSTPQMIPLQTLFKENFHELHANFFSWRPAKIFDDVNIPTLIFFGRKSKGMEGLHNYFSTSLIRWNTGENPLGKIQEINSTEFLSHVPGYFPKLGSEIDISIMRKVSQNSELNDSFENSTDTDGVLYYRSSGGLYYKIFTNFKSGSTSEVPATTGDPRKNKILVSVLSSSLFFWFYDCYSDTRHLTQSTIKAFPFDFSMLDKNIAQELLILCDELMSSYKENAEIKIRNYVGVGELQLLTFFARKSKHIIDKIDRVLAVHYGFSGEETDYILSYLNEYR